MLALLQTRIARSTFSLRASMRTPALLVEER